MCRGCDPWLLLGTVLMAINFVGVSSSRTVFGKAPPPAPAPPSPPVSQSIGDFQTSVNQQSLQSVLNAIELRLRGLDNIYAVRYSGAGGGAGGATGATSPGASVGVGWDALEARLSRLESTYDRRLEAITESLVQKYSLLIHKVDMIYDRVLYMESGLNKLQVTTTKTSERLTNTADRIESAAKAVTRIEQQQIRTNGTLYALDQKVQAVVDARSTTSVPAMQTVANEGSCTLNSSDIMNEIEGAVATIRQHVDRKADIVINKASNSYNDMWRHVVSTESLVKATLAVANATKAQLYQLTSSEPPAASAAAIPTASSLSTSHPSSDNARLESLVDDLAKHITHNMDLLDRHSEERFREIQNSMEAYRDRCHRIQADFEDRITKVLNRLLDVFGEKSETTNKGLVALKELIKFHDNHVVSIISRTITKVVHNASDTSVERDKQLQKIITEISQNASQDSRQIQQAIEQVFTTSSHPELVSTLNEIGAAVQGLREQLDCFNSSCTLHTLLKNMSSDLEKTFLTTCGRSGSFSERYNVSYDEAWDIILGKKNSSELDNPSEAITSEDTQVQSETDETQTGTDGGTSLPLDLTSLEHDDYVNSDEEDGNYR